MSIKKKNIHWNIMYIKVKRAGLLQALFRFWFKNKSL